MTYSKISPWLVCPSPNPQASLRLFCFPYAGGGPAIFHAWLDDLPPGVEMCAAQLPGRGSRIKEAPYTRVASLVQALGEALHPHLDRPFAFFGHSLGALVAFELSRELRRQHDLLPVHLFVSGCGAPQSLDPHPPIGMLPDTAFLEELRQLNGTPAEVLEHEELMQLLLPTLRADFTARETYAYVDEPPLDCPISAFGGMQDGRVERDRLEAWRDQTSGLFSLHTFPGDHFFLHSSQSLLLQTLSQALEQQGTW